MNSSSNDRLVRMLNLVPFFQKNKGISTSAAAKILNISEKQLIKDAQQLWLCGLPGYGPGDLIDFHFAEENISVIFNAGIERPLKLTYNENIALIFALKAILNFEGLVDYETVKAVGDKLNNNLSKLDINVENSNKSISLPGLNRNILEIIEEGIIIQIEYYSYNKDSYTKRKILPLKIILEKNNSYIYAWCFLASDYRFFKISRISKAEVAENFTESISVELKKDEKVSNLSIPIKKAELVLVKEGRWIEDLENVEIINRDKDTSTISIKYYSLDWLERLIMSNMPMVVPIYPEELVDNIENRVKNALANLNSKK